MEEIKPGKYVSLIYDLYTISDDGHQELVHQVDPADPEKIIFGVTEGVIEPLERALDGKKKNDEFNVVANSFESFGDHDPERIMELDKDLFVVDGKFDNNIVKVGNYVPMLTADGFRVNGLVMSITDDKVKLDFNHPLAGKTLRFKGKILDVRDATEEEIHLATSHGCGCGCDHDGCNCNDGDCGCDHTQGDCGCDHTQGDCGCDHKHGGCGCEKKDE